MSAKRWYYLHENEEHGPCADREIIEKIKSGDLSANVLIRREDSNDYVPATLVMRKGKSGAGTTGSIKGAAAAPARPAAPAGPIKVTPKAPAKPADPDRPAPKSFSRPTGPIDIEFHTAKKTADPARPAPAPTATSSFPAGSGLPAGFRPRVAPDQPPADADRVIASRGLWRRLGRRGILAACLLVACVGFAGVFWKFYLPTRRAKDAAELREKDAEEARRIADEARARERAELLAKREAERKAAEEAAKPRRVTQLTELGTGWTNSLKMKFVPVIGTKVLFCVHETRVQDYAKFIESTGRDWIHPRFEQGPLHPVVNVMWEEAMAFTRWLTARERLTGHLGPRDEYRLPSDLGWSAAAGILKEPGSTPSERHLRTRRHYPWGTNWPPAQATGNFAPGLGADEFELTAPVMSFPPNEFGLFDMAGNAAEWCLDWMDAYQTARVVRGGSFNDTASDNLLTAFRGNKPPVRRMQEVGFRLVVLVAEGTESPSP
jgi:hypothetical protein